MRFTDVAFNGDIEAVAGAIYERCDFKGVVRGKDCTFDRCSINTVGDNDNAEFSVCSIRQIAPNVKMRGSGFTECTFRFFDLLKADVEEVDFYKCKTDSLIIQYSTVKNSFIEGCVGAYLYCNEADLAGSVLKDNEIYFGSFRKSSLRGCRLEGDFSNYAISHSDIGSANVSKAKLKSPKGVLDLLERVEGGVVAYLAYPSPYVSYHNYDRHSPQANEWLEEGVNRDPSVPFGSGLDVFTLDYAISTAGRGNSIWKVFIPWDSLVCGCIPYDSSGWFRVPRCQVIDRVNIDAIDQQ